MARWVYLPPPSFECSLVSGSSVLCSGNRMAVVLPLLFPLNFPCKGCKSSSSREDGFEVKISTLRLSQVEALGVGQISIEEVALCGSNTVASPHTRHLLV